MAPPVKYWVNWVISSNFYNLQWLYTTHLYYYIIIQNINKTFKCWCESKKREGSLILDSYWRPVINTTKQMEQLQSPGVAVHCQTGVSRLTQELWFTHELQKNSEVYIHFLHCLYSWKKGLYTQSGPEYKLIP